METFKREINVSETKEDKAYGREDSEKKLKQKLRQKRLKNKIIMEKNLFNINRLAQISM